MRRFAAIGAAACATIAAIAVPLLAGSGPSAQRQQRFNVNRSTVAVGSSTPGCPGGTEPDGCPHPVAVRPLSFSLVSQAGVQPATGSTAYAQACTPEGDCALLPLSGGPNGPIPDHVSVVRPGERLDFAGPGSRKMKVGLFPRANVHSFGSVTAYRLCHFDPMRGLSGLLDGPRWTAPRKPGSYVLDVGLWWQAKGGPITENGFVGVLVSRTRRLGILPRPRC